MSTDSFFDWGTLQNVPQNVSFLSSEPEEKAELTTIGFHWEPKTHHLRISNFKTPDYYLDYLMTTTYSSTMQELQANQAQKLSELRAEKRLPGCSFVEIGCGDGSFLKHASRYFEKVLGIEPSERFAQEAEGAGFEVLKTYVGENQIPTEAKFDAFASRQVFEHLPDPLGVLKGVAKMLNSGAIGLIEVPNGYRALRNSRFYEFFPDHVNYFSVISLVSLAAEAGFSVLECKESFNSDYLELWVELENPNRGWVEALDEARDSLTQELNNLVAESAGSGQTISLWGAGAKTLSIVANMSPSALSQISSVIDSDPHKQGFFLPNTSIPIVGPLSSEALSSDCIIILNLSYTKEVYSTILAQNTKNPAVWSVHVDNRILRVHP